MSGATTAIMIGGAASGAIGSYYSAKSQKASLQFQADIADQNARIAELGAQSELMRGQREEQSIRLRTANLKSRQRTTLAANGVDLGEGSAAEILTSTDYFGEIDANTAAANAVRAAWGYRTQGSNQQNESLVKRATAGGISPGMAATSSLMASAGQVASSWYMMNKVGGGAGPSGGSSYNYAGDASGVKYSMSGADVMARR